MKKFEPIDNNFGHKMFNDRRITDKMGVHNSPERGVGYGYKPSPKTKTKRSPEDPDYGHGDEDRWGGVKPKQKGPKPTKPWGTAKKVPN